MKDFIHGALVKAASTDGIETMLKGAGIGAGANVGIGAVQGDFDVVGNAFSGAALGGIGGAGMKFGANRYAGNLVRQAEAEYSTASKKVGLFSNVEKEKQLPFFGSNENTERFTSMNDKGVFSGRGYNTGDKVITGTERKEALGKAMDKDSPTYKTDLANLQKMQPERTIANMMSTPKSKPQAVTPTAPKPGSTSANNTAPPVTPPANSQTVAQPGASVVPPTGPMKP